MSQLSPTLSLACELIERPSVTPDDAGCQAIMIERLEALGFTVKRLRYGEVDNFWAVHGSGGNTLAFAGHTDVVPAGNESEWQHPPFTATLANGVLMGRGAADMKGSLAAMVTAAERFIGEHPDHNGQLAFLITSDEEGIAVDGTRKVMDYLAEANESIQWCVVGEPSSSEQAGDVIKNGRRGSLGLRLLVKGQQGHVAYPQLAENPVHSFAPAMAELASTEWDQGNAFFPPTSFQVSNIKAGTGATNVIPGTLEVIANFRYSPELSQDDIRERFMQVLDRHQLQYEIDWSLSGEPFLTEPGDLVDATTAAIKQVTGIDAKLSTAGGTSDGRFIAPSGAQVIELGPVNKTIHKVNEQVDAASLDQLSSMYQHIMTTLLAG